MKLLVHCLEGTGHLNACIGVAQCLAARGHELVFVVHENLKPQIEKFGFRVIPLTQHEVQQEKSFKFDENPAKAIAKQLMESGLLSSQTSFEKMARLCDDVEDNFMIRYVKLMVEYNPQIEKILADEMPHGWLHDSGFFPPALGKTKLPWISIASANPILYFQVPELPPCGSGYSTTDRTGWQEYRDKWSVVLRRFNEYQAELDGKFDYTNDNDYIKDGIALLSPHLNIYQFPPELDYDDIVAFPANVVACDTFCRSEPGNFQLPQEFRNRITPVDKMIYVSMGSMGGYDVDMLNRILDFCSRLPYKFIVSKGPRGDELTLPSNCWGENYLPQPAIVEIVDLVITHGGNNSFTEIFAAGKPMIVMPLFGDQYDNAQRIEEKGYGIRLEPYTVTERELAEAIVKLLNDTELHQRLQAVRQRCERENSNKNRICEAIENLIENFRKQ